MRKSFVIGLLGVVVGLFVGPVFGWQQLFYSLRGGYVSQLEDQKHVWHDISAHHAAINVFSPQSFAIDQNGVVFGNLNPKLQSLSARYRISTLPLVTNKNFDAKLTGQFLSDKQAQKKAIISLIQICKSSGYAGVHLDFERVPVAYAKQYSGFVSQLASSLHRNQLKLIVAVMPSPTERPQTLRELTLWDRWQGGYELKPLSLAADYLVLMTYDQQGGVTPPGPTAAADWVSRCVDNALVHGVPAAKLLLGVPTASSYWSYRPLSDAMPGLSSKQLAVFPFTRISYGVGISFAQVQALQEQYGFTWSWDPVAKVNYSRFQVYNLNRYIFASDKRSVAALVQLAKSKHLSGVAVFRLGNEDPAIWSVLH